jgi:hypothetical protein
MRIKVNGVELSVETVGSWPDQLCAALSRRYVLRYDLGRDGCRRFIAHLLRLDHPDQVASLTLVSARPVAPGPVDPDPPDHAPETTEQLFGRPEPDWTGRACVVDCGNGLSLMGQQQRGLSRR